MGLSSVIPRNFSVLAEKIPGDSRVIRKSLLKNNTLLPLFVPFQNTVGDSQTERDHCLNLEYSTGLMMPQGMGFVRTCLSCAKDDCSVYGASYWHRSHQIPGVTCCWKHGEELFDSCLACDHPFYESPYKLRALAKDCKCGWNPHGTGSSEIAPDGARRYAIFSKSFLDENLPPVGGKFIEKMYIRKMNSIGLVSKKYIPDSALIKAIKNSLGDDFITSSYPSRRMSERKKFYTGSGSPINVQLTVALYLYGDIEKFKSALKSAGGPNFYGGQVRGNSSEKRAAERVMYEG
ncbi:hypothetical protein D9M68_678140 [compost metagenome]